MSIEFETPTVEMSFDNAKQSRFRLTFEYSYAHVAAVRTLPGRRFVGADKGGPHWVVPATLDVARAARAALGDALVLSPDVRRWGKAATEHERNLTSILSAEKHELNHIPENYPNLYRSLRLGPAGRYMTAVEQDDHLADESDSYQVADVAFMAFAENPLNASDMGTGKTLATLATIVESGIKGPHLVIAPLSSLRTVWRREVAQWLPNYKTLVVSGSRAEKEEAAAQVQRVIQSGKAERLIVVTNPATVRLKGVYEMRQSVRTGKPQRVEVDTQPEFPFFQETEWGTVTLDEFHKMGLGNPGTLTSRGVKQLPCQKRIALSGTPMGGKPLKLFGILQWLEPKLFTSKWQFAENFLEVVTNTAGYREIGGVRPEREEDFHTMLSRYMVRRTKEEVLPWLPPIQRIEVDIPMEGTQAAQYKTFAEEAEIRIDELKLTATGVLAEYTRLKQFANSECEVEVDQEWNEELEEYIPKVKPIPTERSNKIDYLLELLEELGVDQPTSDQQVVIFSQFVGMVENVCRVLSAKGIPTAYIHGGTTADDRASLQDQFQEEGGLRVLVMNTLAGGVAITLDRASTVVFMDETWDPDDQQQAEARCHRASRIHQVTSYYLRSENTVEEHIRDITQSKQFTNFNILDARREGLRA
jgi:SNF2 family DNA or RNA helicase